MDRIINFLFFFLLIGIFVLVADATVHRQILVGALLSILFCFAAFVLGALSLDGMAAATVVGTYVFGLGGLPGAAVLVFFFVTSALISRKQAVSDTSPLKPVRRDGLQVWANGFWFVTFLAFAAIWSHSIFIIGALGALATAMADTWATELGSRRFNSKTYLITNFRKVKAGSDGGVSRHGFTASLVAGAVFALFAIYVFSLELVDLLCIFVAGFSGCLLDSYFGAVFQRHNKMITIPSTGDSIQIPIDNNLVNFLSTGAGSIIAIIIKLLFV